MSDSRLRFPHHDASRLRSLSRHLSSGGSVVAYHGVTPRPLDPARPSVHVTRDRLAATLRALKRVAVPVSLRELLQRHTAGKSTKGLFAITFDDAYVSVLSDAWPVFQDLEVPLTVFVVLERAGSGAPFWWDRVEHAAALATPERWQRFEIACALPDAFRTGQPRDMGRLRPLRQWVLAAFRGRWPTSLDEPLAGLEEDVKSRTDQRPMTFDELDLLMRHDLVDVGVHTATHPVLPLLSDDELRSEIRSCFNGLKERYPRTLPSLAHPFGLYDARTVRIASETGMRTCLGLSGKQVGTHVPAPLIPRFCMTARHEPWKVALLAIGCWHGVRSRKTVHRYPELPSSCT